MGAVSGTGSRARHVKATGALAPDDEALFERLRAIRKELADRQSVPAYIVFSDKVLVEMATRRPTNERDLLEVPGVGPAKLEKYGATFLEAMHTAE
jgi:ATP-dependent DNA helicase RecQ